VKAEALEHFSHDPKIVLRVHEVHPKPPDYCGTNYMEGYDIGKVLEHLELKEVPKGCGCGCRGTKKLAKKLGMDIGCALGSLKSTWDESIFEGQ